MRLLTITAAAAGLLVAGAAVAQERVSDQQYVQLSRCVGLAAGLDQDGDGLNQALRDARSGRAPMIMQLAQRQQTEARSQASRARGSRLAELQTEFQERCGAEAR